jgi:hypothetical protein
MRRRVVRLAFIGLMSGLAVAGLGPAGGTAQAAPNPACEDRFPCYTWCPGEPLPDARGPIAWDMGVCHDYYYAAGNGGDIIEGIPAYRPQPLPPWQP